MTAMTREERNKRQADLRRQKQWQWKQSIEATMQELWQRAEKERWTLTKLLAERDSRIFAYDSWRKLPAIEQSYLFGYWGALLDRCFRSVFVFTHVLDGQRIPAGDKRLEGRYSELAEGQSAHCWPANTDGYYATFNLD